MTATLPYDLGALVEQLHATRQDAESADVAFTLARDLQRRLPGAADAYGARLRSLARTALDRECADLCERDWREAVAADPLAVAAELERAGWEWAEQAGERMR